MAQHDYTIANQGFPATREDLNNVLDAIRTNNSGTSAPSEQYAGQFWLNTTSSDWELYIHDGADDILFATIDTSANTVNFIDSELGDNSVTTAKIADGNVTSAKLSYPLTTFSSTGIDDNATSTAITIDSSERVGIGTSSPVSLLHVTSSTGDNKIQLTNSSSSDGSVNSGASLQLNGTSLLVNNNEASGDIIFRTDGFTERMRINNVGNVGIGTSSPVSKLTVAGQITATSGASSAPTYSFDGDTNTGISRPTSDAVNIVTNGSERMRIDSSGNLLVGKTSANTATVGVEFRSFGLGAFTRSGNEPIIANRTDNDGKILQLQKDGTEVGSIGAGDGDLIIGKTDSGTECYLRFGLSAVGIAPANPDGSVNDNALDLGATNARFDDIYATNGTIQTSDQNEKQSIQSLTTAEMNVAKRLSPLIKTFKWNSSVEEKGDNARTHTGIIAQDVQQAFADEGLDAGNYALFISSTWWENSEGDIQEEATDGYTKRTRLGVRYPELLSFIQAYNDQRFTELEARITALETNQP